MGNGYQYQSGTILEDKDIYGAYRREVMGPATSLVRERQETDHGFHAGGYVQAIYIYIANPLLCETNINVRNYVQDVSSRDSVYLGA